MRSTLSLALAARSRTARWHINSAILRQLNSSCLEFSGCQVVTPVSGNVSRRASGLDCDFVSDGPERARPDW